jgi:hypothetical protein
MNSSQITTAQRIKAIVGGSIGNLVEWYDWYAYAAFAIYFSNSFSGFGYDGAAFKYSRNFCCRFSDATSEDGFSEVLPTESEEKKQ